MSVKIIGRKTSVNVQKVLWVIEELDLPYERINAGGTFGGLNTEAYLEKNPHGLIPLMEHGQARLWESNTIARYLLNEFSKPGKIWGRKKKFIPTTYEVEQWMDWGSMHLGQSMLQLFYASVRTAPKWHDAGKIEQAAEALKHEVAKLDKHLSDGRVFVLEAGFSGADISIGSMLYRYYAMDFERADLPWLRAYFDRLLNRPAYRETILTSFEPLRVHDKDVPDPPNYRREDTAKALVVLEEQPIEQPDDAKALSMAALKQSREALGLAAKAAVAGTGRAFHQAQQWMEKRRSRK